MRQPLNHGTETETLEYGGPMPVVIDERGGSVRVSVWQRPGSRRDVFVDCEAARRVANAALADADDGEVVTETADDGSDVVVRERNGHRELTLPRQLRRGRRVVRLTPFEEIVAEGLRDAAAVVDDPDSAKPVATDGGVDSPLPATGTIVPKKTGYRASFDCATEYMSEADEDYLDRAVAAAANEYGVGREVRVRFTGSGYTCNGFELLGPVDETPDDVQRLNDVRRMLDTSRWPSLTPEQTDRIEDAFDTVDSVTREVQTEDEDGGADIDRGDGVETDGGLPAWHGTTFACENPDSQLLPEIEDLNPADDAVYATVQAGELVGVLSNIDRQCVELAIHEDSHSVLLGTHNHCDGRDGCDDCLEDDSPDADADPISPRADSALVVSKMIHCGGCSWTSVHLRQLLAAAEECPRAELHIQIVGEQQPAVVGTPNGAWWCLPHFHPSREDDFGGDDDGGGAA